MSLMTVVGARAALAIDTKTYMGAFCVPLQNVIGADQRANLSSAGGKATAKSGTTLRVSCPIIKDNVGDVGLDVRINVFLASGASSITCTLASYWWDVSSAENFSNMLTGGEAVQTVTGSNVNTTVVFSNYLANTGIFGWGPDGYVVHQLYCDVSSNSSILSYQVKETGTHVSGRMAYPSAMCREDPSTNTARYNADFIGQQNMLPGGFIESLDNGPGTFAFSCPIITDNQASTTGLAQAQLEIGNPISTNVTMTCTLDEADNFTNPFFSQSIVTGFGATDWPSITNHFSAATSGAPTWARYNLYCRQNATLGDGKILNYRIVEN